MSWELGEGTGTRDSGHGSSGYGGPSFRPEEQARPASPMHSAPVVTISGSYTIAALLCACLAFGQGSANTDLSRPQGDSADYTLTVHSNLVFLPTRVQTKSGETVYGLKAGQFIVEDNGVPQRVQVDEDPESPRGLSLVLAVQCGRSAPDEFPKLKGLSTMIDEMVGEAPHEIAVLAFGERPYLLQDFSSQADAVPWALSKLKPCGDYHAVSIDAVSFAIGMLRRRQNRYRRAILLISEMRDHGSRAKLEDAVAELGATDTVIYSVAFSPARDDIMRWPHYGDAQPGAAIFTAPPPSSNAKPTQEPDSSSPDETELSYTEHPPVLELPPELRLLGNALKPNAASELASLSGGEYINFATQSGFERGLQRIANQIHDYYVLSFKPSAGPDMSLHTLTVRVVGYPNAVIQTRRSYWSGILDSSAGN